MASRAERQFPLVTLRREQPLPGEQRRLDLRIARQDRCIRDAEPFRRLALRQQEIVHTLLAHDPRGFVGHGLPHQFGTRVRSSTHLLPLQNKDSSPLDG
jgi:hypothetical protein